MDLRSRGASEIEVQQFFKDHVKFCTIVFREWLQGARGEPPLFSDVDPRLAQRIEDCAKEASLAERMRARETLSVTTKPQQSQRHQESARTSPKGSKKRKGAAPNSKPKKGSSGGSASPRKQSRSEPGKLENFAAHLQAFRRLTESRSGGRPSVDDKGGVCLHLLMTGSCRHSATSCRFSHKLTEWAKLGVTRTSMLNELDGVHQSTNGDNSAAEGDESGESSE